MLDNFLKLVPFSGIQILAFQYVLASSTKRRTFFRELAYESEFGIKKSLEFITRGDVEDLNSSTTDNTFSEQYEKVIDLLEGIWLPAPFFYFQNKKSGLDVYDFGPTTWARMRIRVLNRDEKAMPRVFRPYNWTYR